MRGISGMSVHKHHLLCLGLLNECYAFVPLNTQKSIKQSVEVARKMGADVDPDNLDKRMPLAFKSAPLIVLGAAAPAALNGHAHSITQTKQGRESNSKAQRKRDG